MTWCEKRSTARMDKGKGKAKEQPKAATVQEDKKVEPPPKLPDEKVFQENENKVRFFFSRAAPDRVAYSISAALCD